MCIYYRNRVNLNYTKKEHIFPAGLGGKATLPLGYVSDAANELFSPKEMKLMHNSLISMERFLFGPGKRGSLSLNKASKSQVTVGQDDEGTLILSYTSKGRPYCIPQFYRADGYYRFHALPEEGSAGFIGFVEVLKEYQGDHILLLDKAIPENQILVGYFRKRFYVGTSLENISPDKIKKEIAFAINSFKPVEYKTSFTHVKQHHRMMETPDITKAYAKTAMNVLAKLRGEQYALLPEFNDFAAWIVDEGEYQDFDVLPKLETRKSLTFPDKAHWCMILPIDNYLCSVVCFYNLTYRRFTMGKLPEHSTMLIDGLICDWQNNQEYTLLEWVNQLTSST